MSASPPSSTALRTPQSAPADLPPTRSGRQRKTIQKLGSVMDSEDIMDFVSEHSDDDRWEDEEEDDEDSFGGGAAGKKGKADESEDDWDAGDDEDDEGAKKKKKSKKSKPTKSASAPSRSSKPSKGKATKASGSKSAPAASRTAVAIKKPGKLLGQTLLTKKLGVQKKAVEKEDGDGEDGNGEKVVKKVKEPGPKSKTEGKSTNKKTSVPAKRPASPAASDAETLKNDDDEDDAMVRSPSPSHGVEADGQAGLMTPPASPFPSKKAKTAPFASKPSLALPKTAGKPLLGTSTSASGSKSMMGVQLKPAGSAAGKPRGGGISLAKKESSVLKAASTVQ